MGSFRTIARAAATLLSGVVAALVVAYAALIALGYKPVVVYSGSMEPKLGVGSIAFDRPIASSAVRVGDVITFTDPYQRTRLVTHRVVRVIHTTKGVAYRTKGDANVSRDRWTIRLGDRVGRVAFDVPYAGYALWYLHTRELRVALILLSALFLSTWVLRRIWRREAVAA
jgi:signal peptidase